MFPVISGPVMHHFIVYTLIAVMILHYRYCHASTYTEQYLAALSFMAQCICAMRAPLTWQCSATSGFHLEKLSRGAKKFGGGAMV